MKFKLIQSNLVKRLNEFKIPKVLEMPEIANSYILKPYVGSTMHEILPNHI